MLFQKVIFHDSIKICLKIQQVLARVKIFIIIFCEKYLQGVFTVLGDF